MHSTVQAASVASNQWHLDGAGCAWDHTQGERVVVAVMDTGMHPSLDASYNSSALVSTG